MGRVVHFEIKAADPQKAAQFYEQAFGWKVQPWGGDESYLLVSTGERGTLGIDGGIQRDSIKDQPVVNTIGVGSLDETIAAVKAAGGAIVEGPMEVPGVGMLAYGTDPNGVAFGIMEPFPDAMM